MSRLTSLFNALRCVMVVGALLLAACAPPVGLNLKGELDEDDLTKAGLSTPENETETPDDEETSEPEDEAESAEIEFVGEVSSLGAGEWVVDDQVVPIDEDTEIEEGIAVGDFVEVEALVQEDGSLVVLEIKLADEDEVADEAENDDDEDQDEDELDEDEDEHEAEEDDD